MFSSFAVAELSPPSKAIHPHAALATAACRCTSITDPIRLHFAALNEEQLCQRNRCCTHKFVELPQMAEDPKVVADPNCTELDTMDAAESQIDSVVYAITSHELEVEKFLTVDSWNQLHGIDPTAPVRDDQILEMNKIHEEGNRHREDMLIECTDSDFSIQGMDGAARALLAKMQQIQGAMQQEPPSSVTLEVDIRAESELMPNPYSITDISNLPKAKVSHTCAIEKLKGENELLRSCLKHGDKGDFSAFIDHVAGRTIFRSDK